MRLMGPKFLQEENWPVVKQVMKCFSHSTHVNSPQSKVQNGASMPRGWHWLKTDTREPSAAAEECVPQTRE